MIGKLLLNERFILSLIVVNAIIIFISGFGLREDYKFVLSVIDNIITLVFFFEILFKYKTFGLDYLKSNWNRFDVTLVLLSIPSLLAVVFELEISNYSFLLVLRVMRIFKSFRLLKFVPGIEHLIQGIKRALKASVIVIFGFIVYVFIIGLLSFYLFKDGGTSYFTNPMTSLYSIFKIFTVEGWFEIPEQLTRNMTETSSLFTYIYFILILVSGGIFGLSLVNSIFVDAMVCDNNEDLEKKIDLLNDKITNLINQSDNGISE